MPKYRVPTDQGIFMVTLDSEPSSEQELRQLVEEQISGTPSVPSTATQTPSTVPSPVRAALEPFRRVGTGLVELPFAVGRGVAGLKDIDYTQLVTEPGTTLEAAKKTGEQMLPAIAPTAGAVIGSTVG